MILRKADLELHMAFLSRCWLNLMIVNVDSVCEGKEHSCLIEETKLMSENSALGSESTPMSGLTAS